MRETPEQRSRTMQAVKSANTAPELTVRRLLHAHGYRYRLHCKALPGKPDIVFPGRHKVIFVHGCFWHAHTCPRGSRKPKANNLYWVTKLDRNRERDKRNRLALMLQGWRVLTVWECQLRPETALMRRLSKFLES